MSKIRCFKCDKIGHYASAHDDPNFRAMAEKPAQEEEPAPPPSDKEEDAQVIIDDRSDDDDAPQGAQYESDDAAHYEEYEFDDPYYEEQGSENEYFAAMRVHHDSTTEDSQASGSQEPPRDRNSETTGSLGADWDADALSRFTLPDPVLTSENVYEVGRGLDYADFAEAVRQSLRAHERHEQAARQAHIELRRALDLILVHGPLARNSLDLVSGEGLEEFLSRPTTFNQLEHPRLTEEDTLRIRGVWRLVNELLSETADAQLDIRSLRRAIDFHQNISRRAEGILTQQSDDARQRVRDWANRHPLAMF